VADCSLLERYRKEGVVYLKGALSSDELAMIAELFEYKLAHRSSQSFEIPTQGGGVFITNAADPNLPQTHQFTVVLQRTPIVDLAAIFLSSSDIWFYYEQLFYKHGGKTRRTPWHQDTSYVPVEGPDIVRFWICLDPVDKEHSLEFVRASYLGQLYNGSSFNPEDDTAPLFPDSDMPRLPDIEASRSTLRCYMAALAHLQIGCGAVFR
jgi:ectoine hydroxylase-related dioxygenase (phytanoyl-CoA dioxygenase family)